MDEKQHKIKFAALIEQAGVVYDKEITRLTLESYWAALKHVDIGVLEQAMAAHICSERWFPRPCELRGPGETAIAMRAWDSAITAVQQYGAYRSVDFEDQAVNATIRYLGGWERFCAMGSAVEDFVRKDFLGAYREMRRHGISSSQAQFLPGLAGRQREPVKIEAPVVAGVKAITQAERSDMRLIESSLQKEGINASETIKNI